MSLRRTTTTSPIESAEPPRAEIVCLSRASNPYLGLLYGHLDAVGVAAAPTPARLSVGWLYRSRTRIRFLHFHWPEGQYRFERGPSALRPLVSWVKLALFGGRLAAARLLGYRLVWTIHQVLPHETTSARLDRLAARLLARSSHLLLVHDEATLETARRDLGRAAERAHVVLHGSYVGVYPPGRSRDTVRAELGLPAGAFVFLVFGQVRPYKDIELVLEAFTAADLPEAALVVAGPTRHPELARAIEAAASADPRITPVLEFVADDRVAELFAASDAAVVARGDGGTSGSLILALSLGVPAVYADTPTYRDLTAEGAAGWAFRPGEVASLRAALGRAARDPQAKRRGESGLGVAHELRWSETAQELARLLDQTLEDNKSRDERKRTMDAVMKALARIEGAFERAVGAVLRGTMAVLVRVVRRGRHRDWRRTQGT